MILAIKGHPTRGKEVIQLLEMLCTDRLGYKDTFVDFYYYIECDVIASSDECPIDAIVFTLEEFEKKFPYKVGDKVSILAGTNYVFTIKSMTWDSDQVIYKIKSIDGIEYDEHDWLADELIYYTEHKEETMEESDEKAVNHVYETEVISFDIAQRDKYELDLQGKFEVVLREGKYYVERIKPQYPKTYGECCEVLAYEGGATVIGYDAVLLNSFQKLKLCRDAYWKIAGEEMRLDKSWKPDWCNENKLKYCIECSFGTIDKTVSIVNGCVLAFPTAEMRDAFYENFKEEIEMCKELL